MKESLQKLIDERLSSPIFSYITFYLIVFNWKSFSILFLSKEPVEQRIVVISNASSILDGLILPSLIGVITAMASPYLHNGLSIVHRRAIEWNKAGMAREEIRNYERTIGTTDIRIRAEHSERLSLKRMEVRESILIARKEKIDSGIVKLLDQAKKAEEDKNEYLTQYHMLYIEVENCEKILDKYNELFSRLDFSEDTPGDIKSLIKERKLFSHKLTHTKNYSDQQSHIDFEDDIPF